RLHLINVLGHTTPVYHDFALTGLYRCEVFGRVAVCCGTEPSSRWFTLLLDLAEGRPIDRETHTDPATPPAVLGPAVFGVEPVTEADGTAARYLVRRRLV